MLLNIYQIPCQCIPRFLDNHTLLLQFIQELNERVNDSNLGAFGLGRQLACDRQERVRKVLDEFVNCRAPIPAMIPPPINEAEDACGSGDNGERGGGRGIISRGIMRVNRDNGAPSEIVGSGREYESASGETGDVCSLTVLPSRLTTAVSGAVLSVTLPARERAWWCSNTASGAGVTRVMRGETKSAALSGSKMLEGVKVCSN